MKIGIHIYQSSTERYDISDLVRSVNWSGDVSSFARTLEVELQNAIDTGKNNLINIKEGSTIQFFLDGNELFRGFIFKNSIDEKGSHSITAYDQLVYLSKNSDTILVKNKAASDVVISLLKKYGLTIGSIESTGYKIKKLFFQTQALTEIIQGCLDETEMYMGRTYKLYSQKGKVYMVSRRKAAKNTISVTDIISGSRESSIEDTKTQVMVTKGSLDPSEESETKYKAVTVKDANSIKKYGVMQHVETVDDKATESAMKKKAQSLLNQLKAPEVISSIEFIGDSRCTTGNIIEVRNEITDLVGKFYISSDKHTFSDGVHKMSLQLSSKLE
jgi:hypothetical protein